MQSIASDEESARIFKDLNGGVEVKSVGIHSTKTMYTDNQLQQADGAPMHSIYDRGGHAWGGNGPGEYVTKVAGGAYLCGRIACGHTVEDMNWLPAHFSEGVNLELVERFRNGWEDV